MVRIVILMCAFACAAPVAAANAIDVPPSWKDPSTGMEFVPITGGCYPMGDTFGDGDHNERPVHEVCVDDFYIGKYEVTQGQWTRIMDTNPSAFAHGDDYPVESIMLSEIEEFIRRLNQQGKGFFRLPSEAEWEYVCRNGGQPVRYGTGGDELSHGTANYFGDDGDPWPETAPVGTFPPNALGVHEMSGNVWEWVADVYASDGYEKHTRLNPLFTDSGPSRLVRGGAWSHDAHFARCSKRHMHCRPSVRYDIIGFRLVREAPVGSGDGLRR
ncbi:MAG: formylglycine-generating enzyme family protein [Gammaproteobacteria bacterium]|nr:formylglycine-generating enzyme family protein [Gammaproteobacteria bacterium]